KFTREFEVADWTVADTEDWANFAASVQFVIEQMMLQLVKLARKLVPSDNLCIAGGVALNCTANWKIIESKIFKSVYVPPYPTDMGCSIGAALYTHVEQTQVRPRNIES